MSQIYLRLVGIKQFSGNQSHGNRPPFYAVAFIIFIISIIFILAQAMAQTRRGANNAAHGQCLSYPIKATWYDYRYC
jgi:hypothetical protein